MNGSTVESKFEKAVKITSGSTVDKEVAKAVQREVENAVVSTKESTISSIINSEVENGSTVDKEIENHQYDYSHKSSWTYEKRYHGN